MPTPKSKKKVARPRARSLHVIGADGKRQEVVGATGVLIRHGSVEIELSFPEGFPLADEFVAELSSRNHLLTLGPGHGNRILVRATGW